MLAEELDRVRPLRHATAPFPRRAPTQGIHALQVDPSTRWRHRAPARDCERDGDARGRARRAARGRADPARPRALPRRHRAPAAGACGVRAQHRTRARASTAVRAPERGAPGSSPCSPRTTSAAACGRSRCRRPRAPTVADAGHPVLARRRGPLRRPAGRARRRRDAGARRGRRRARRGRLRGARAPCRSARRARARSSTGRGRPATSTARSARADARRRAATTRCRGWSRRRWRRAGRSPRTTPAPGELTIWCSAQDPHRPLAQLSHVLDRPDDTIRLVVPDVGGAFGSKGVVGAEVAGDRGRRDGPRAAGQVGRGPARELPGRLPGPRDGGRRRARARRRRPLLAVRAPDLGGPRRVPVQTTRDPAAHRGDADVRRLRHGRGRRRRSIGARTDKVPTGPYRGAGRPEAAYFLERAVDDAARAHRHRPRRAAPAQPRPHVPAPDAARLHLRLRRLRALPRPGGRAARPTAPAPTSARARRDRRSRCTSSAPAACGRARRRRSSRRGRVVIRSGSSPHGQGHETTFAQIAADRLGVADGRRSCCASATARSSRAASARSRRGSVAMGGSAIVLALDKVIARAPRRRGAPARASTRTTSCTTAAASPARRRVGRAQRGRGAPPTSR